MSRTSLSRNLLVRSAQTRPGSTPHYRWRFFGALSSALARPIEVANRPPTLVWANAAGGFDHAQVLVVTEPDGPTSKAPRILRIGINSHSFGYGRWKPKTLVEIASGLRRPWKIELSVLAEELVAFAPWVAALVRAHEASSANGLREPPHPCHFWFEGRPILDVDYGWSRAAWDANEGRRRRRQPRPMTVAA